MGANNDATGNRAQILEYLYSILGPLRDMAKSADSQMLAYLLDMALIEAGESVHGPRRPKPLK